MKKRWLKHWLSSSVRPGIAIIILIVMPIVCFVAIAIGNNVATTQKPFQQNPEQMITFITDSFGNKFDATRQIDQQVNAWLKVQGSALEITGRTMSMSVMHVNNSSYYIAVTIFYRRK